MGIIFASIATLSFNTMARTVIAVAILLLFANYLKKDNRAKVILYALFAAVILISSTVLVASAIVHIQGDV